MKAMRSILLILLLAGSGVALGQEAGPADANGYHVFAVKESGARTLEARVQSISEDRKTVQLVPRSGSAPTVSVEILRLSLESQQYLRDWMARQRAEHLRSMATGPNLAP